jgi:hypothetical protein
MTMLPSDLLTDYVDRFFGFGSWNAGIWFIGIEEAGGETEERVKNRLRAWDERGRKPLEDAPRFYPAEGRRSWHGPGAEIQPTWRQLIRMLFLAQGRADTEAAILEYQRRHLGAADGETSLMELLPLPSPSTGTRRYNQWSELPWLRTRQDYLSRVSEPRAESLRRKVSQHRPKVVVFYGTTLPRRFSLLPSWSHIAGGRFDQAIEPERILLWRQSAGTVFFVTRHPTVESDEHFRRIGGFFRDGHRNRF